MINHLKPKIRVWTQYTLRSGNRDNIESKLTDKNIPTAAYYPMPPHLQACFDYLGYKQGDFSIAEQISSEVISLPMNEFVTDDEIENIIKL